MKLLIKIKKNYLIFFTISIFISAIIAFIYKFKDNEMKILASCESYEIVLNYKSNLLEENASSSSIYQYLKFFLEGELEKLNFKNSGVKVTNNIINLEPVNCEENKEKANKYFEEIRKSTYKEYTELIAFINDSRGDVSSKIVKEVDIIIFYSTNIDNIITIKKKGSARNYENNFLIIRFLISLLLLNIVFFFYNKISFKIY